MSLKYHYEFTAPASVTRAEIEEFLHSVQKSAAVMGFDPTLVMNVPFDSEDRRDFARRLGGIFTFADERLKGSELENPTVACRFDPAFGDCRVFPEHGVALVATNEHGEEACFGFFRFPESVRTSHGVIPTGVREWRFSDFVQSPDPRYRKIVDRFDAVGYLVSAQDEFDSHSNLRWT
jgi:hypothetical protein